MTCLLSLFPLFLNPLWFPSWLQRPTVSSSRLALIRRAPLLMQRWWPQHIRAPVLRNQQQQQ